jgi:hypothetical protein
MTTVCLGLGDRKKTYAYYRQTDPAGSDINRGGSSTLGVDSTFGGIRPGLGRKMSAPRLGHRRQDPPPTTRGLGPMRHASWPRTEKAKPPRAERVTAQRLQALLHLRLNQRAKGRTAMQAACNCTKGRHPFDFDASSMGAQAHTSCNQRTSYNVRETAPPLAPVPRLLDCGTGAATRGNPAHGPIVPTEHIGHGSVSRRRRRDGRYGQKWTDSNGGSRRAEAAVKSSAGSRPLLERQESPLPRREDDVPVFRSSNGSRTHNGCPANHSSRRINSAAGQAAPLAGEAGDASPPP